MTDKPEFTDIEIAKYQEVIIATEAVIDLCEAWRVLLEAETKRFLSEFFKESE